MNIICFNFRANGCNEFSKLENNQYSWTCMFNDLKFEKKFLKILSLV